MFQFLIIKSLYYLEAISIMICKIFFKNNQQLINILSSQNEIICFHAKELKFVLFTFVPIKVQFHQTEFRLFSFKRFFLTQHLQYFLGTAKCGPACLKNELHNFNGLQFTNYTFSFLHLCFSYELHYRQFTYKLNH